MGGAADKWSAKTGDVQIGHFIFCSDFDSGNGGKIVKVPRDVEGATNACTYSGCPDPWEYHVYVAPDCADSDTPSTCRTWFYFSVRATLRSDVIREAVHPINLVIRNMQNQHKLYKEHYCVFMRQPGEPWHRVPNMQKFQDAKEDTESTSASSSSARGSTANGKAPANSKKYPVGLNVGQSGMSYYTREELWRAINEQETINYSWDGSNL